MQRHGAAGHAGVVRGGDGHANELAGGAFLNGRGVHGQDVALVDDERVVAEFLRGAVVVEETVVFPLHVVELGVNIGGEARVAAEFVREKLEAPAHVAIAVERADAAVFAVDERLGALPETVDVVEGGAGVGLGDDLLDVLAGLGVVVEVEVPGIDVGVAVGEVGEVVPVDDAHVLDEAGGVELLREFPHALHPLVGALVLERAGGGVRHRGRRAADVLHELDLAAEAPRLVERAPGDDGGMVEVATDGGAHRFLVTPAAERGVAAFAEIREVAHEQHADGVGVVEDERVVDLDVDAQEVEAAGLRVGDVVLDHAHVARGVDAVGEVTLVKRAAQVDGAAVEHERGGGVGAVHGGGGDLPRAEVGAHEVGFPAGVAQAQNHAVELGIERIPQHEGIERQRAAGATVLDGEHGAERGATRGAHLDGELGAGGSVDGLDVEVGGAGGDVRGDAKVADVRDAARLHEDGLPDAARGRIPLPLLADGLLAVVHGILDAQHDHAAPVGIERVGEVKLERVVAALVVAEMHAVAPRVGEKIRRAHGEDRAPARPLGRHADLAPIPADLVARRGAVVRAGDLERIPEDAGRVVVFVAGGVALAPRGEAFPAEGHEDLLGPRGLLAREPRLLPSHAVAVEAELPRTVEIQPIEALDEAALAVGAGIFRSGILGGIHRGEIGRAPSRGRAA